MLQAIRERAQGWIAWVIVGLISIPFALWGIQSYLGVGSEPAVAKVYGVEITERDLNQRVQRARVELRDRLGAAYDPALFDEAMLRTEVLNEMIQQTILLETSNRIGMRVSDQEVQLQILAEPAFHREGRFDRETYDRLLRIQGLSPAQFEAQLRQQLIGNQLSRALLESEILTRAELEQYRRFMGQTRDLVYARVALSEHLTDEPVDEAAIEQFYRENAARFQMPEMVKLDYIVLDVDELARATGDVEEADLQRIYDEEQMRFGRAEQRSVRHLLRNIAPDADASTSQAVLDEIQALRERILAGADFAEIAKVESQDPGSAAAGGSLGTIEQGLMVPAFDEVAFSLPAGQLSEPVRTQFGYHLIEVTEIIPARVQPFDEVKETLREEYARHQAESVFYDIGERLANSVYESPDSLEPAAAELGLELKQSDWIGREGGDGVLSHPRVIAAAFNEEVLESRLNSDLIEPEPDVLRAVVLRVSDHRAAAPRPLDEARSEVVEALQRERASAAAEDAANALAEQVRKNGDWPDDGAGLVVERPGPIERVTPSIATAIRDLVFTLPLPLDDEPSVDVTRLPNGDLAVVQLLAVEDGEHDTSDDARSASEGLLLSQLVARQTIAAVMNDLERRAEVERRALRTAETDF
ncbi:MAG: peptidylprolyl isomerase [Sphingobacteriia bacterium]|nr:peptidylprolyl isomerase [Sphingobacteriia bacterium]NCC38955.1 peptidylprolyl isomerase [Gammaproteobacteria bacterium]